MLCSCPCRPRCSCRECFVTRSLDDDDSLASYDAGAIIIAPAGSGICRTGYTRIVREVALPSGAGCTCSPCNNGRICERLTDKLHALAATIQPPVPRRAWRLFFLIVHAALRVKVGFRRSQIISAACHPWDVAACPQYSGQNCSALLSLSNRATSTAVFALPTRATGAGCTCSPRNTGAGCTCSPCNN
jgi:hypothetical protein